jgi:excinuclease UvrABC nuclease subunit
MPRRPPKDRPTLARPQLRSDDLTHAAYAPATAARRRALLAQLKADCADRPGIYRMLGATGLVVYVGKAKRLRTRLLSYFRAATKNRRRDKQARILRHAHGLEWEYAPSEFAALLLELREIKRHRPRFNVLMNVDGPPRGWLALGGAPVPALRVVTRSDDPSAELLYGPFRRILMLEEAGRALAEATGVRDCAGHASGPARGACMRAELRTCRCPGVAPGATPEGYAAAVAEVRDFLAGRTTRPLDTLRARMEAAAEAWQFERAAALRERVAALGWLRGRLERFHAGADRLTFAYRVAGADGRDRVYLVRRGTVRAEVPAPATEADRQALAALADRVFRGPDPTGADVPTHDLDEFYLVASWFRRHPDELAHVERPD